MADQTYNLTQTGAEVQAIINDANGVKGAGATTSLTTDYIMLKDTSGAYHKIQKSSFTEAVRNTLASLLVNNDKGTTISQIAAIASGDFGSVTPANLASVLGGVYTTLSSSDDLNNVVTPGLYYWSGSGTAPSNNFVAYGSLLLVYAAGSYVFQIQIPNTVTLSTNMSGIGIRKRANGTWDSKWGKIDVSLIE